MKQRSIEIATFVLFLLPLLLILAYPSFSSKALGLDQPAVRSATAPIQRTFYGMGGLYDGWVLESGEFTGIGGSMNVAATTIALGDDVANRQFRGIISFNTAILPATASIQSATIYLTGTGVLGASPFVWSDLKADVKRGFFGSTKYVQLVDFQAAPSFAAVGSQPSCAATGSCLVALSGRAFPFINRYGLTQFRLRFALDDNNNKKPDYYKIYSGDTTLVRARPLLVVKYYP
jgi:hypothetical protein